MPPESRSGQDPVPVVSDVAHGVHSKAFCVQCVRGSQQIGWAPIKGAIIKSLVHWLRAGPLFKLWINAMYKLVLIRHGESTWNLENRFTGWVDVDLTPTGVSQAMSAGQLLKAEGYEFDIAYTSVLKRHPYAELLPRRDGPHLVARGQSGASMSATTAVCKA